MAEREVILGMPEPPYIPPRPDPSGSLQSDGNSTQRKSNINRMAIPRAKNRIIAIFFSIVSTPLYYKPIL